MNTTQDDGGPDLNEAQEYLAIVREANSTEIKERNLRDWFAGMALQGFISSYPRGNVAPAILVAPDCYEMADAMLAARKEQP